MGEQNALALEMKVAMLLGGVGGAKLAQGMAAVMPGERLSLIVNTGDDFWRWGLRICPDLDTVMYTLADLVDPAQGWGLKHDSFATLNSLKRMYALEPWFRLGDKDLATHLYRASLLREGKSLSEATAILRRALGIEAVILPMCDEALPTRVDTLELGELDFQEYFVKHRWGPTVKAIRHQGSEAASLTSAVADALREADIVIIAPSNPWLSLAPILSVPCLRALLAEISAPVVAVTPIIGGEAVKGPTAKIMRELGLEPSAASVIEFYGDLIDAFVDDIRNPALDPPGLRTLRTDTLMRGREDKANLARTILHWAASWNT